MRIATLLFLALWAGASAAAAPKDSDPVLQSLVEELERSRTNLAERSKAKGEQPLYYLSYRVSDGQWFQVGASFGALEQGADWDDPLAGRMRYLDVSARVGSP